MTDHRPGAAVDRGGLLTIVALAVVSSAVAQSFGRFTYPLLLTAIQRDFGISYTTAGSLGTANLLAYLLGTAGASVASTRWRPASLVKVGLVWSTAGLGLLSFAPRVEWVLAGLIMTGVGGALIWIPAPGLVASAVSARRRGMAIGVVGAGIGGGTVLATVLTALVRRADPAAWRPVYLIELILATLTLSAVVLWLHPPVRAQMARARLSAIRTLPGWRPLAAAYTAFGLAFALFVNYLVAMLEDDAGFGAGHAGAVFAVWGATSIFGGLLLGRLSDRWGRPSTMAAGFATMAVCSVVVLAGVEPWVVMAVAVFGLAFSGTPTVIAAYVSDHLADASFGAAYGALTLFFGVAAAVGPQVGGVIADSAGSFTWVFLLAALVAGCGAVAAWALRGDHRVSLTPG